MAELIFFPKKVTLSVMDPGRVVLSLVKTVAVKVALRHGRPSTSFWGDLERDLDSLISGLESVEYKKEGEEYRVNVCTREGVDRFSYSFWLDCRFFVESSE